MINNALEEYLDASRFGNEAEGCLVMLEAMRYSLQNGGKRIRPVLTLEFCELCGGEPSSALAFACALEMVHTYSLIHDDLPCMDNDDMRRGKPSSHIKFGQANALLAGDALLTLAFETVAGAPLPADSIAKACAVLARAAGMRGMIAGQVMDIANEGRSASLEGIKMTDRLKTGAMIIAAGELGCIAAGACDSSLAAAREYCEDIGLAFQIVDDILDVTSSNDVLGKPVGSDSENNKSTYVSLLGLEQSRRLAFELSERAVNAVSRCGENVGFLSELARVLCTRSN